MKILSTEFLQYLRDTCETNWIVEKSYQLNNIELGQSFKEYKKAAQFTYNLLKAEGFEPEMLTFPADGKTVYLDARTPLGWRISHGSLTVVHSPIPFENPVIADYEAEPFSVVKHSVSTPPEGIVTRIRTEAEMRAGADCKGALIFFDSTTRPRFAALSAALDAGAIGFVSDNIRVLTETPDCVQWLNAGVDGIGNWHAQCDDRDFIGYMITPRTGKKLREACGKGTVEVKLLCDGERYEGEIDAVMATLSGKSKKEVWITAHLYEAFIADNSASVVMAIAALKKLRQLQEQGMIPQLEYTVRVLFAMEVYGYAAIVEHFGGSLRDRTLGGINLDTLPIEKTDTDFSQYIMPYTTPFFGNYLLKIGAKLYEEAFPDCERTLQYFCYYCDDNGLGDSTVGLPMVWPQHQDDDYHHNSIQNEAGFLDNEKLERVWAFITQWVAAMACSNRELILQVLPEAIKFAGEKLAEEAEKTNTQSRLAYFLEGERKHIRDFKRVADIPEVDAAADSLCLPEPYAKEAEPEIPALKQAAKMICSRVGHGFPQDLVHFPRTERKPIPDGALYGPMGLILSGMDGKKNLAELICGGMWECGRTLDEKSVEGYIDAIRYLEKGGYVIVEQNEI